MDPRASRSQSSSRRDPAMRVEGEEEFQEEDRIDKPWLPSLLRRQPISSPSSFPLPSVYRLKSVQSNLHQRGIGGLGAEFADIFRRAFASRVFPPHVTSSLDDTGIVCPFLIDLAHKPHNLDDTGITSASTNPSFLLSCADSRSHLLRLFHFLLFIVPSLCHVTSRLGIKHVKGMLLFGPPGTGKTLMARQIGKMLNGKDPKIVNGPEVLSKFVGETENNVRDLFADAEQDQRTLGKKKL
ncbi:hypothetical protein YC2023_037639 [Brassica napus]